MGMLTVIRFPAWVRPACPESTTCADTAVHVDPWQTARGSGIPN